MSKIKIMLADDHAVVREGFTELIKREDDMQVIAQAANGAEAIALADIHTPDVILMDISMPEVNGIEATRTIKQQHPAIAVLVLTAYDNEEFIFAVLEAGAAGYMLKNVKGNELLNAIRAVNNGDMILHPDIAAKVVKRTSQPQTSVPQRDRLVLTDRELEVVAQGARGLLNKEIAGELGIGERTVQSHWRNIFVKIDVGSRVEAIMYCLKREWITA